MGGERRGPNFVRLGPYTAVAFDDISFYTFRPSEIERLRKRLEWQRDNCAGFEQYEAKITLEMFDVDGFSGLCETKARGRVLAIHMPQDAFEAQMRLLSMGEILAERRRFPGGS